MGRPPKNEDHVLVRLRRALSTPNDLVTRKKLAARIGVSPSTIREIETGKFRLTEGLALRLMIATGVSTKSLINAEDPLKDLLGKNFTRNSGLEEALGRIAVEQQLAIYKLMGAALRATEKMKRGQVFYQMFNEWLPQALERIGAIRSMKETLNLNLGIFDPQHVPAAFWPTQPRMKRRWDEARQELTKMSVKESEPAWTAAKEKGDLRAQLTASFEAYQNILDSGRLRDRLSKRQPKRSKPSS
jgi:plasmid maintenance system antidote protein VapI